MPEAREKKLFLIDAFAMIYRAHFAFIKNPRINSKGFNTSCILGFTNTLLEIITKEKPTHLAVCFDTPQPTFRHEEFKEYKAQREAQPEEITAALPIIRDMLAAFNIPILQMPGYEADDVVGTVATTLGAKDYDVYMLTSDKDYAQLVSEHVFLFRPNFLGKGYETYDVARVLEKWDIKRIDQVIDFLGLKGDAVDNIPGIPGVGDKTAVKLLAEYDTVENIVANADKIKGKLGEKVAEFGEQGILSKHLARIVLDVPIEYNEEDLKYDGPDKDKLTAIFDELEFKTLARRVFGESTAEASPKKAPASDSSQMDLFGAGESTVSASEPIKKESVATRPHHYHLVDTEASRKSLVSFLLKQKEVCFDTETTSVDAITARMVGMSFSYYKGEAYYVPVPADKSEAQAIVEEFRPFFENKDILKVGQNLKYDVLILQNYDVEVSGPFFDTMISHYLLQPEQRHGMDDLAENYLNYETISIETLIGKKGKNQGNMGDVDPVDVVDYASEDADITLQLKHVFAPQIEAQGMTKLFEEIELPLLDVLAKVERNGITVDESILKDMSKELEDGSLELEKKIYELAGAEFNIASPRQLGEILFDKLKLDPKAKKTKTGQYATGEDILVKLAADNEIIDLILSFREYRKLKSTYVDALPKMINPATGRIHTSYRQTVAATGRLSSDNPNLQNIPVRTEKGRQIRKAFVKGSEDHVLLSADYSQIELRIMAAFSGDEAMIDAFKNGRDIHATTASKVFGVPIEDVDSALRSRAKAVNFGIIYGISAFGLANNLNISRNEARELIEDYFREFPKIKSYMDDSVNKARDLEYCETLMGRRRYLREINSRNQTQRGFAERNAINAPIQGSAADIIKVAMINIQDWMEKEKLKSKMILQVHDELIFDTHLSELDLLKKKVPEFMSGAVELAVPLDVDFGVGDNWLEAH